MGAVLLAPAAFKVRFNLWVRYLRVIESHPEGFRIQDGLWRPGGVFPDWLWPCTVMSHHSAKEGL